MRLERYIGEGVFACGNVLQVHDLVDFVSEEAEIAGKSAVEYLNSQKTEKKTVDVARGKNVSYVLPQKINANTDEDVKLFFRVTKPCKNCTISIMSGEKEIAKKKKK